MLTARQIERVTYEGQNTSSLNQRGKADCIGYGLDFIKVILTFKAKKMELFFCFCFENKKENETTGDESEWRAKPNRHKGKTKRKKVAIKTDLQGTFQISMPSELNE